MSPNGKVRGRVDYFGVRLSLKSCNIVGTPRNTQSAAYSSFPIPDAHAVLVGDRVHLASFYACSIS